MGGLIQVYALMDQKTLLEGGMRRHSSRKPSHPPSDKLDQVTFRRLRFDRKMNRTDGNKINILAMPAPR